MTWTLFIITLTINGYSVQQLLTHTSMQDCFAQREQVVRSLGKPTLGDYQAVCISRQQSREFDNL